jgi:hypothetical protein
MQKALQVVEPGRLLWAQLGSNQRPPDYESLKERGDKEI